MKSSGQKAGFSITVMIGVIIAAGVGVDWWDARQSRLPPTPVQLLRADDAAMKRMMDDNERLKAENERLKTDVALHMMQNDELRKQVEELSRKTGSPAEPDFVEGEKPDGE